MKHSLVAGALLGSLLGAGWGEAKSEPRVPAQAFYLDHHDVSPPLRDIALRPPRPGDKHAASTVRMFHPVRPVGQERDNAAQSTLGPVPSVGTTPGLNRDGVGVGMGAYDPNVAPPDTNGSVGDTQYVQWVNLDFAVFDKVTGALTFGPAAGSTLWAGFGGPCEFDNDGDPIAIFDKAAHRWVMSQFAVSGPPYYQCIAVSTTQDATGTYRRFSYQFSDFNDYPKFGVWPDAYYVTFNMFAGGQFFSGGRACAVDRNAMITPADLPGPIVCFQLSTAFGGLLPADLDGATPPASGTPNYVMAYDFNTLNRLQLWKFHVDFVNPGLSTFGPLVNIPVAAFAEACGGGACIPQGGTSQQLASLGDRMMYRLAYRNFGTHESLLLNHSVSTSGRAAVRWYEVRNPGGVPVVQQQSTYAPDTLHRWMGSIAQDKDGNMALGYSVSASTMSPALRYTGRLASDPLNTMQAETSIIEGTGSQTLALNRWGDYSSMSLDPADDCTFWFTSEYLKANGTFNWSTRLASFRFPSCGGPPTPDFTVSTSPSAVSVAQGSSASTIVTVSSLNGFSAGVSLSASGLPSGVTAAFVPNPVTPPGGSSATSTATFTASATATTGTFPVTLTGISGALAHNTSITLTVNPSAAPDFTITLTPTTQSVAQGSSGTYTVNVNRTGGFTGAVALSLSPSGPGVTFSPNPATGSTSTLTVPVAASTPTGTYNFTVTGTSGALTRTTTGSITVTTPVPTPNFSLSPSPSSVSVTQGSSVGTTITVTSTNGFASGVTLSASGLPSGVTASFAPNPISPPANGTVTSTLTFAASATAATGTVTVTVTGAAGALTRTTTVSLTVNPVAAGDYTLSLVPTSQSVARGATANYTVNVNRTGGFSGAVTLSINPTNPGVTFTPNPATGASSTLAIPVPAATPPGTYNFTVTGTSGALSRNTAGTITVQ